MLPFIKRETKSIAALIRTLTIEEGAQDATGLRALSNVRVERRRAYSLQNPGGVVSRHDLNIVYNENK